MSYSYEIVDNIIIFKFNHGKTNSINQETLRGLEEVVDKANNEEQIKGIIMTGEGRYFSSGFDLETFTSFKSGEEIVEWFKYEEEVLYKLFTCKKPLITAINGHATAAGMIVSMAADYRIAKDHPKIKLGMTEIKIGLSLTPAEGEIMRFGLDTDKNYRDIIFNGELVSTGFALEKGIIDELVENDEELIEKAKAKIVSLIDTPGRPFIMLKYMQKMHTAKNIRTGIDEMDWQHLVDIFMSKEVQGILNMVKGAIS